MMAAMIGNSVDEDSDYDDANDYRNHDYRFLF